MNKGIAKKIASDNNGKKITTNYRNKYNMINQAKAIDHTVVKFKKMNNNDNKKWKNNRNNDKDKQYKSNILHT